MYQRLGNLSVEERAADPLWAELQQRQQAVPDAEVDLTDAVDAFAERADGEPASYRWSYTYPLRRSRLVVVDSRAARELEPGKRSMLDDAETAWLGEQLSGDVEHLLVATSLPYLLPMGLHHVEALNEAMADGRLSRRLTGLGEKPRQEVDLEVPWRWHGIAGPWFDNNIAVLEIDGEDLRAVWLGSRLLGEPEDNPALDVVANLTLDVPPAGTAHERPLAQVHLDRRRGLLARLRRRTTDRR